MEPLKERSKTLSHGESLNENTALPLGMSPQNLFEAAATFSAHLGGSPEVSTTQLMTLSHGDSQRSLSQQTTASHIDKMSSDFSLDISRLSNEVAMNGQSAAFSIFMPRLGRLDVRTHHTNNSVTFLMKTDSRPFRDKLKANKEKMERSVSLSMGKKAKIRVLDDE